jgi:hypothetical protein
MLTGGPLDAIAIDCRQIISNRLPDSSIRDVELSVLSAGADLLSREDAEDALNAVLHVIDSGGPALAPGAMQIAPSRYRDAWIAAAALGSTAGASSIVAERLLEQARTAGLEDELWDRMFAEVVSRIMWSDVAHAVRADWTAFVAERADPSKSITADAVQRALDTPSYPPAEIAGSLNWAAERLNYYLRQGVRSPIEEADRIFEIAALRMRTIATEAKRGHYSSGVVVASQVASGALSYIPNPGPELWEFVLDFLTNPEVPRSDRTLGFDALTVSHVSVPSQLVDRYRERVKAAIEQPEVPWVAPDVTFTPYPSALRFAFAYRFISSDDAFTYTAYLMARQEPAAIEEAAAALTSFSESSDASWIQTLAVQLSHDGNPNVRAQVIQALARTADQDSTNADIAANRLAELLRDDGVIVPLRTLAAVAGMKSIPAAMRSVISELQGSYPSKRVRDRAAKLA